MSILNDIGINHYSLEIRRCIAECPNAIMLNSHKVPLTRVEVYQGKQLGTLFRVFSTQDTGSFYTILLNWR